MGSDVREALFASSQGLDVQHVAMAQKKSRDPHAAAEVLRKVLEKHHHQRETRNYDPDAHKESSKGSSPEPPKTPENTEKPKPQNPPPQKP